MMAARMPSPIGHALAGLTVGWLLEPQPVPRAVTPLRAALSPLALGCAAVAALPDADLLIPHFHRTATHSVTATGLVLILAIAVTGWVTGRQAWRWVVALGLAHSTHLLLDWLGVDRNPPAGLQMFWPFDPAFYISGWDIFPPVARGQVSSRMLAINAVAAIWELALMGPVAGLAWLIRRRRQA
jgi:membrane-bound metal-dependent hydrolase YbcI (DUF457 family)